MGLSWRRAGTVVPLVITVSGAAYGFTAWGYGLGSGVRPGPGLFPFAVAVALVVSAAVWLWTEARTSPERHDLLLPIIPLAAGTDVVPAPSVTDVAEGAGPAEGDEDDLNWSRVAGVAFAGTLVIPLSTWVGLVIATGLLVAATAFLMRARAIAVLAVGVVFVVVAYLLFEVWLGVPLPDGFLLR